MKLLLSSSFERLELSDTIVIDEGFVDVFIWLVDPLHENLDATFAPVDDIEPPVFLYVLEQVEGVVVFGVNGCQFFEIIAIYLNFGRALYHQSCVVVEVDIGLSDDSDALVVE